MAQMRLDKFLGEMGIASRSQIKEMARKGREKLNRNRIVLKWTENMFNIQRLNIGC